jgi:hypothetical protein
MRGTLGKGWFQSLVAMLLRTCQATLPLGTSDNAVDAAQQLGGGAIRRTCIVSLECLVPIREMRPFVSFFVQLFPFFLFLFFDRNSDTVS